ncbi:MAG: Disulfide bond isomerase protein N-terminus, partial [Gammaproteobacteria bacterium]|nr:Disulfide bond isomerase protein N-terminus [Gammaproteobacteria bacterium]
MLRVLAVLFFGLSAFSLGAPVHSADQQVDPRVALLKLLPPGSKLDDLRPSPIAGVYEFSQGADVSYLTADGR